MLPGKRGPRYVTRRCPEAIEQLVLAERAKGCNRYETYSILKPKLAEQTPAPSTIYAVLLRHGQNRLEPQMQVEKQPYVRDKAGELAHLDCYHLSRDTIASDHNRYYLLAIVDDATRLAWVEVMPDIKALSTMFATLKSLNELCTRYNIRFAQALTDNGPEFGPKGSASAHKHPFSRPLLEMSIKHGHTRPYRPQTNDKAERFWCTLDNDLINGTHFDSLTHFKDELFAYLL